MKVIPREYFETGLVDEFASPINEGDEVTISGQFMKEWSGEVVFKEAQFFVEYYDKSLDPLSEVAHVCTITKHYNHVNFNEVLKKKIVQLQLDLIKIVNEQS